MKKKLIRFAAAFAITLALGSTTLYAYTTWKGTKDHEESVESIGVINDMFRERDEAFEAYKQGSISKADYDAMVRTYENQYQILFDKHNKEHQEKDIIIKELRTELAIEKTNNRHLESQLKQAEADMKDINKLLKDTIKNNKGQ